MTDDIEALIKRVALPWLEEAEQSFDTDELAKAGQAVRALLKAYQERGPALEAASPVVPVGMRERVLDELDGAWLHGQRRTSWRRDESADAILAALRPTDTGREA
jgi:hypothetical protein